MRRAAAAVLAAGIAGLAAAAEVPPILRWLDREAVRRIEVTGYRRLGLHFHSVTGDRESFDLGNYYGQGDRRFTDIGQIDFVGRRVFGLFNFRGTILDSRFSDPQGQRFSLDYERDGWTVGLGDIQGTLTNTNPLARFSKTLRGASVGYRAGRFDAKALTSEARGSARTVTIPGNNTAGPYYLQANQLVNGSEQVRLDGQPLQVGRDYVVSYESGFLTLVGRTLAPTSVLVVSFEVLGFNERRGLVQGLGASYDLGRAGRVGVTFAQQLARTGGAASSRLEQFQGFGAPSTPYILTFEPLPGRPITVQVDGIVQQPGVDYRFDAANPAIFYLNRFVPATSTVSVTYTPRPTSTATGDREVMGLDWRIPFGPRGQVGTAPAGVLTIAQAHGRLFNSATPLSGTARSASLDYRVGPWDVAGQVRAVPEGFVSVETRGFNRNETGHEARIGYQADPRTKWTLEAGNRSIVQRTTFDGPTRSLRFADAGLGVTTSDRRGATYGFEVQRQDSRTAAGPTRLTVAEASTRQTLGRLDLRLSASRQAGRTPAADAAGSRQVDVGLTTAQVEAALPVDERLRFTSRLEFSDIDVDGDRGAGRDVTIGADYQPTPVWRATLNVSDSDSGRLARLGGFGNGWGLGYGGNGFAGGVDGNPALGASRSRTVSAGLGYTAGDLSVQASAFQSRQSGAVTSNSDTTTVGLGAAYEVPRVGGRVLARVDRTASRFVGSASRSESTTYSVLVDVAPPGRWSGRIGYSALLSGGDRTFGQDSGTWELSATHDLGRRQALIFDAVVGDATGYLAQANAEFGLTYQYRLWSSLALNAGYRIRDVRNRDAGAVAGAYRASSFDLTLDFNFSGR